MLAALALGARCDWWRWKSWVRPTLTGTPALNIYPFIPLQATPVPTPCPHPPSPTLPSDRPPHVSSASEMRFKLHLKHITAVVACHFFLRERSACKWWSLAARRPCRLWCAGPGGGPVWQDADDISLALPSLHPPWTFVVWIIHQYHHPSSAGAT